ncbi:unnamed protein product [Trifolium pratense]|uniref:Uncharacterized protein n=1 Tax=Trifolium pratense TaxID=57577 RepID=A0ACB0KXI3_TRIPR|nr:unnamed protein product [Trifolium pratense]
MEGTVEILYLALIVQTNQLYGLRIGQHNVSQLKSAEPLKHFSTTKVTTVSLESYLEHRVATEVIFKFNFRHFSLDCTFGTLLDVYEYE